MFCAPLPAREGTTVVVVVVVVDQVGVDNDVIISDFVPICWSWMLVHSVSKADVA